MVTIHLTGQVTENGELIFETPQDLPPGKAKITIEVTSEASDNQDFTEEEIKELRATKPLSGKEIVESGLAGGWEHKGITDSVAWVEELRRKQKERNRW